MSWAVTVSAVDVAIFGRRSSVGRPNPVSPPWAGRSRLDSSSMWRDLLGRSIDRIGCIGGGTAMTTLENPVRNGVDTAGLFATIDAVKANPEIARFQFRAT